MFRMMGLLGCLLLLTISFGVPSVLAANQVLSLDGIGDYVEIPDSDNLDITSEITAELWFNADIVPVLHNQGATGMLISKYDHGTDDMSWSLGIAQSGFQLRISSDGKDSGLTVADFASPIQASQWYHVAFTYDGTSQLEILLNGNSLGTSKHSGGIFNSLQPLKIGVYDVSNLGDFDGLIDGVRLWDIRLTQKEIQTIMNKKLRGDESGLVGYWDFDNGTANSLTGSGNDGELQGGSRIIESDLPLWLPTITSITPNYGSVSGGTPVIVTGNEFQNGATISISGSKLVDMIVFPEVGASVKSRAIDITDAATNNVTLNITLKEKYTPEVTSAVSFPTDSEIITDTPTLKNFIETGIAISLELAGKIIVSVDGPNSATAVIFTTVDKGTGVQFSVDQKSGSDVLFSEMVSDSGGSKITGTTSSGTLGLHDVVVTNSNGGSDTLVRGFAYMTDCELPPGATTNTLSVTGTVYRETEEIAENGLPVEVNIISQNLIETDVTGRTAGDGQYSVTFDADKLVARAGDEILVTAKDAQGNLVGQSKYTLTTADVEAKAIVINVISDEIRFTLKLFPGINLISLPVALEGWRMSNLAEHIGKDNLSMIMRYDYTQGKFTSYLPTFPDNSPANVIVQCGMGYIVLMKVEKEIVFEGRACQDEIASPSLMPMVLSADAQSTPIFVVTGKVKQKETSDALNEVAVRIRNLRTGQTVEDITGTLAGYGNYVATFVAPSEEFITRATDKLEITALDKNNRFVITPVTYTLTTHNISDYVLVMPLHLSLPKKTALLQNYPNPFNPETWLPYQLAQDANVTVSIYSLTGQLVRTLRLGNQSTGVYVMKHKAAYWDGRDSFGQKVASGVYFYTLQTGDFKATRKLTILK